MSFVLIVSEGVTAKTASHIPAPRPASKLLGALTLPSESASISLKRSYVTNRTPAFTAFPATSAVHPEYSPVIPFVASVERMILNGDSFLPEN